MQLDQMYDHQDKLKKRHYNARIIQVEKGTFTPVVFSCTGGASPEASRLMKLIALKRSQKRQEKYSDNINFVRRRVRFDVLRTCLLSFRGTRNPVGNAPISELDIEVQQMEQY